MLVLHGLFDGILKDWGPKQEKCLRVCPNVQIRPYRNTTLHHIIRLACHLSRREAQQINVIREYFVGFWNNTKIKYLRVWQKITLSPIKTSHWIAVHATSLVETNKCYQKVLGLVLGDFEGMGSQNRKGVLESVLSYRLGSSENSY